MSLGVRLVALKNHLLRRTNAPAMGATIRILVVRYMDEVSMDAQKEVLGALLRIWSVSEGAGICDRCGETIWPEIELVRCDRCIGKHGAPEIERVREAEKKHWQRIRAYEREMNEPNSEASA